jgi:amidophosphoribosyltransferase
MSRPVAYADTAAETGITTAMCGLIGVTGNLEAARDVFVGLMNLQHRGQDGAGILTVVESTGEFNLQKGSGLIENIFSERTFNNLPGRVAIGHARYATVGRKDPNLLQPFLDDRTGIGLAHNGNIVNFYALREEIAERDKSTMVSDSEAILRLLSDDIVLQSAVDEELSPRRLFDAIGNTMQRLVGSYAVVGIQRKGILFGFRDPHGIRPLVLGKKPATNSYALASETVSLQYLGFTELDEIAPGEAVVIEPDGTVSRKILLHASYSPCMFEWVYFARIESEMGEMPVYKARFDLGLLLADQLKQMNVQADVVVPVPETSRVAAIAIAEALKIPHRELLIKNRYVNRTFILEDQEARQAAIKRKLYPIASELANKRCLIVDDSIVRGNTAAQIIEMLRQAGAKEVILVSTCPPIRYPCFYGIDFPSPAELVASNRTEEEVATVLGADRVIYLSLEGLKAALQQKSLCTGCLDRQYPTDVSMGDHFETQRNLERGNSIVQRT